MTISKHVSVSKTIVTIRKEHKQMLSRIASFVAWILDMTGDVPEMEWFDRIGDWLAGNKL